MKISQSALSGGSPYETSDRARQIDSAAWAVFFIWVGIAMLANVAWGWFLAGTGILILMVQFGRWWIGAEIETFWLACGAILLAVGVWRWLDLPWPLVPLLLIILGAISLASVIGRARH